VGFVVDKVALGQVMYDSVSFPVTAPCSLIIPSSTLYSLHTDTFGKHKIKKINNAVLNEIIRLLARDGRKLKADDVCRTL
jgi:hypothetical protein